MRIPGTRPDESWIAWGRPLTPRAEDEHIAFWKRPEGMGVVVLLLAILLNAVFW